MMILILILSLFFLSLSLSLFLFLFLQQFNYSYTHHDYHIINVTRLTDSENLVVRFKQLPFSCHLFKDGEQLSCNDFHGALLAITGLRLYRR